MKRKNKQLRAEKIINKKKLQAWHIDYEYGHLDNLIRLADKSTPDDVCSELTDDPRLLSFMF